MDKLTLTKIEYDESVLNITPIHNKGYKLNYDNIKTINDVINILKHMDITFYDMYAMKIPKEYLVEVEC